MDSTNLFQTHALPDIDRARGGVIRLHLVIPSQKYITDGACGQTVITDEMQVQVTIDIEKLPLVNLSGYTYSGDQIGPAEMPYDEPYLVKHDFEENPKEPKLEELQPPTGM